MDLNPDLLMYCPPSGDSDDEEEVSSPMKRVKATMKKALSLEFKSMLVYESVFKPIEDPVQLEEISQHKYLFQEMEIFDDISKGQRGFNRNIARLGNQLIQFYKKNYPREAE